MIVDRRVLRETIASLLGILLQHAPPTMPEADAGEPT